LPSGSSGGVRDAIANLRQTPGDVLVHYFFSWAIMPLACVAYWPSGASFT
jgi:hypothetical protein